MYNQGIRGTQVNSYFLRKPVEKSHVFNSDLPAYSISAGSENDGQTGCGKVEGNNLNLQGKSLARQGFF
jgi:hypothetical protein